MNVETLALLYVYVKRRRNVRKRKQRRWWVRPILRSRKQQGAFNNLVQEMRLNDSDCFFNFYRMTPDLFENLLQLVGPSIQKKWIIREPISASERLSLTLRYLVTGDSMMSIMYLYRISVSSVSKIISEVCEALWIKLSPTVLPSTDSIDWVKTSEEFNKLWNFPNCCGALDGKHIVIQAPANTGSEYYNYKGTFSIVLLALCDANYVFTCVDIGAPGRQSDGGTFAASLMSKNLENKTFGLPDCRNLPHTNEKLPHIIVGDAAFPLKTYLMRPYPGKCLNDSKTIFNYRLSRARRTIENAFGVMVARMRILRKPIIANLETVKSITKAVVVLHNYLQTSDISKPPAAKSYCPTRYADYEDNNGILQPGLWRQDATTPLPSVSHQGSNRHSSTAANIRDKFSNYFMTSGSVPWQWNKLPKV